MSDWPTAYGLPPATVDALRAQYEARGAPRGALCVTKHCLCVATVRVVSWPVLPREEHPIYCDYCAAHARLVLEALGHKYADVWLPRPAQPGERRRFDLEPAGG